MRRFALSLLSTGAAVAVLAITSAAADAAATATTTAAACFPATTQPFAAYGDVHPYFLVPGGSFEAGTPAWQLVGGAGHVSGNNTAGGDPLWNTTSLSLPAGSSATSPAVCVDPTSPVIRFYVRNTGASTSKLGLTVLYTLPNGTPASLLVEKISATGVWRPTASIRFLMNMLAKTSATGTTQVAFQFRPLDATGHWRIDDVYVDPFKRT
ncbi:MAG TPA: hypothetical protein VGI72_13915 [Gaiellales bacterium]